MKKLIFTLSLVTMISCQDKNQSPNETSEQEGKIVVYQVFTRLFGNQNTTNKPWGTIEENGVGKFEVFDGVGCSPCTECSLHA